MQANISGLRRRAKDTDTLHLKVRCQQRGIRTLDVDCVCRFGSCYHGPGGALIFHFGWRAVVEAARDLGRRLDHLTNIVLVFVEGRCVTAYRRARPMRHWR
ncbi:MAG: hypothetical protein HUU03_15065 [Planctomycetaceae bacterium]|nr:hypothetical protein [Planctomycetota bacterium]NUO17751.1 hypothetical protein [Planctomycetaceae bacterium]HRJ79027.1 hypothetical protein [Planctomycetota bacterium]